MQEIVERLAPGARVVRCEVLKGGVSADVQAVTLVRKDGGEERVVVRRHREIAGKDAADVRAAKEYALLGVLHARGVAVARPRLFVAPDTLVQDLVEGSTVMPEAAAEPLARMLAAIHGLEIEGLPGLARFEEPTEELGAWVEGAAGIMEAVPRFGGPATLLHGDYWPGNVMWRAGEIAAVLDWEDAAIGDPMSDLACARVELACAAGMETAEDFTAAYRALRAVDEARLPLWDLFVSSASLQYMDRWGLEPALLEARRCMTQQWQAKALTALRSRR